WKDGGVGQRKREHAGAVATVRGLRQQRKGRCWSRDGSKKVVGEVQGSKILPKQAEGALTTLDKAGTRTAVLGSGPEVAIDVEDVVAVDVREHSTGVTILDRKGGRRLGSNR
ncbi:hypothetical protein BHM03_00012352, partial [Ensete ventricosum]